MRARVVIVGSAGAVERLTYAVPPALADRVAPGHRVLVPLRSRRVTAMVTEVGEDLDAGGVEPKPIIELLEPRPLFDRAHLELIDFLAAYYMAPIGEAYRNVIPAAARVESRRVFRLGRPPDPLALATMTAIERAIIELVGKRPAPTSRIARMGGRKEIDAALARLAEEGFIRADASTRGRHREGVPSIARLAANAESAKVRAARRREILARLAASPSGVRVDSLELEMPGAGAIVRAMAARGIVELAAPDFNQPDATAAEPSAERTLEERLDLTGEQSAAVDAVAAA
ncbi:MAG TPA: hypothetical protein VJ718_03485, partial [Candidatus Binataceae bacterium]|nr:hypothetical protein [Candidatus Binataceae bacterium]